MKQSIFLLICIFFSLAVNSQRTIITLEKNWKFTQADNSAAALVDFNDSRWQTVAVPHDWAITGPFDKDIDKQVVAITQNNEKVASEKTGRTGFTVYWCGLVSHKIPCASIYGWQKSTTYL